ncbi:ty3-gypsy retrotransposon protein [Cucumis melo var. makuwa]|uniref:Ty3-gypsy retrotransposon protein n=1 Tax=Cucumis melo var. makuwa TaxID=1194695 RepID=A0A5A7UKD4_CUCMM|nr:ty3-gypsy retrotransposon protein [Cucumis melo var. makuwa]TYJ95743.1 ty3-gypsy retrotransposon protein [Cucumis melo var. makuwa]
MYVVTADNEQFKIIEETNYEEKELNMVKVVEEDQAIIELSINSVVGYLTQDTLHYGVILGSLATVKGKGICEAVELMLNEWKIVGNILPLELGGVDVVLGMQWLYIGQY